MESIPKDSILEFNPDTLQFLRQQYNLDKPGAIEEAINLLEKWIKKQPHFRKKDFPRDYLERTIIISKGSVERAKFKLDRICTYRTLHPQFFRVRDIKKYESFEYLRCTFMRKLTKEHYRTFIFRSKAKTYPTGLLEAFQFLFMQCEYIQAHDYCNGLVILLDFNEANMMETVKAHKVMELRQVILILKVIATTNDNGYGMKIKGIHILSQSRAIDALVTLFKQIFSAKLASRIAVHKTVDTLYDYVPKEILPKEYGGNEKTLNEMHDEFLDILTTKEYLEYMNEINKATTNEDLRVLTDEDKALGVPGTFRSLNVD